MGRAVQLLEKVLAAKILTPEEMAAELVVPLAELEAYRSGKKAMPLDRQQLLALLVAARAPEFARESQALRVQVAAALAFETRAAENPRW